MRVTKAQKMSEGNIMVSGHLDLPQSIIVKKSLQLLALPTLYLALNNLLCASYGAYQAVIR